MIAVLNTGVGFAEPPVPDGLQAKRTDDVCRRLSEDSYEIDGRAVHLPVRVRSAAMLMNAFAVPTGAVETTIDGSGFRPLEIWPGKAPLLLIAVDYRESDLGSYREGAILFPVLTPGQSSLPMLGALAGLARGSISHFVYRMPVDQPFTTHAGRFIWGFPKWVAQVQADVTGRQAWGGLRDGGELIYEIAAAGGGRWSCAHLRAAALAIRDGRAWKTRGAGAASAVTFRLGGAEPRIGDRHPLARQLRSLGLPKKPLCTVCAQVRMRFERPQAVAIGEPFPS